MDRFGLGEISPRVRKGAIFGANIVVREVQVCHMN
jgi:hypothetical protein